MISDVLSQFDCMQPICKVLSCNLILWLYKITFISQGSAAIVDRWSDQNYCTGCVVLADIMPRDVYDNWCYCQLQWVFCWVKHCLKCDDFSHELLVHFARHFGEQYGKDEIWYNVHHVHLCGEVKRSGVLDNVYAFQFENCFGWLGKLLRKSNSPVQQVMQHLPEQKGFSKNITIMRIHEAAALRWTCSRQQSIKTIQRDAAG
jgi:hypothetical protein